jgi:hypothetical protein
MTKFAVSKVAALPGTLAPSTLYFVSDAVNADLMKVYLSDSTGASVRHLLTKQEVDIAISTAVSAANAMIRVADIAARDALTPPGNMLVLVTDATGDPTVLTGAATYFWDGAVWTKMTEFESVDVVQSWANLQGKPTSTVAAIDAAVAASHSHTNKAVLDLLTDNAGALQYNGSPIATAYTAEAW